MANTFSGGTIDTSAFPSLNGDSGSDPISSALSGVSGAAGILKGIFGTDTDGTTSTSIDKDGMNYLLQQLLSGNGGIPGLADVSEGKNAAGLYNSATNTLLTNDLTTRAAGLVASKNTTTSNNSNTGASSLGGILGTVGGAYLGGPVGAGVGGSLGKLIGKLF